MKSNILLTFDYELFLGANSGAADMCILQPTNAILSVLEKHNAKAIFFVDATYLWRLKEVAANYDNAKKDFDKIAEQVRRIAKRHYVYLHIHPHWCDAVYMPLTNTWDLSNNTYYAFSALAENERQQIFENAYNVLSEILSGTGAMLEGYRAGGLYITPFEIFKPYFLKYGIKYEFSVLEGAKGETASANSGFHFSHVPGTHYSFTNDVLKDDKNGLFTQYAMFRVTHQGISRLLSVITNRILLRFSFGKIPGIGSPSPNSLTYPGSVQSLFSSTEVLSVETLNPFKIGMYLHELKSRNYLHVLSHPKLISKYNLLALDMLLKKLNRVSGIDYDFKNF